MATSVIEICNNALLDLGEDAIVSLTDNTKAARLCNQRWPAVRDAVLRAHPWKCAAARAELAASGEPPAWRYSRSFPLPSDCLRALAVASGGSPLQAWEVGKNAILCDADGPLDLAYVRRIEDPRLFDSLLCETLTARLSATLAYPITASTSLAKDFWSVYAEKLREARGIDAREAAPIPAPAPDSWLRAKFGR